jgi:hypothetical protein
MLILNDFFFLGLYRIKPFVKNINEHLRLEFINLNENGNDQKGIENICDK